HMTFDEFNTAVDEAIEKIPAKFKHVLEQEGIEIIPREIVPQQVREKFPKSIVFGVFAGLSKKQQSSCTFPTEPTRIEIYQQSFEQVFGPYITQIIKDQISCTVVHEIAHYFGFNEEEVAERGY
ncbi:metallopeptidase family protein, partial [bacterium]|nr:metallopeptidase family protein [bacterium]